MMRPISRFRASSNKHRSSACTALSLFLIAVLEVGALGGLFQWIEEAARLALVSLVSLFDLVDEILRYHPRTIETTFVSEKKKLDN